MVTMNIEQAEAFFKKYDGKKFHMFREDYYHYQLYERLNVPEELEMKWRKEIKDEEEKARKEREEQKKKSRKKLDWIDELEMLDAIFEDD